MSTPLQTYISPAVDICGELSEARSDLFRAEQVLFSDHPTQGEIDTALREITAAVQRIDYATDLLKAERKRT